MLFCIIMLGCASKEVRVMEKGIKAMAKRMRENVSRAIQNNNNKAILEKLDKNVVLMENDKGLLAIEEAMEARDWDIVNLLMKVEVDYPKRVYKKIVGIKNIEMFNLISEKYVGCKFLSIIKESKRKELEDEFMRRIEATELERLLMEGKSDEIKAKSKEWILENYRDEQVLPEGRRISTMGILCVYGEALIVDIIRKIGREKEGVEEYALHSALILEKEQMVKFLLENGIDVNKKLDRSKLSALMCASHIGNIKICKLLLEKGAKADVVDEHGCTALKLASENGHKEICKLLLENGAAVDWRKENGIRSLVVAAQGGYKEICELLLENGADVNAENKEGWRALMSAAQEGHKEVCELLLAKGAKVDATDENGWTALMLSAQDGDKVLCILLIEKGAEVNLENCSGVGALMVAAQEGHKEVCELLLEKGAKVDVANEEGWTALMLASKNGHKEICELLLERGAKINASNNHGWMALMLASKNGHKEICELLLERGAEIGASNERGWTALMLASKNGNKEICELLLERGAKINASNSHGWTLLMIASANGNKEICELLLERGAEIGASNEHGWTALMTAALNGHKEICNFLIEEGIEVNATGASGETALVVATSKGYSNTVESLISHGARFDQIFYPGGVGEDEVVIKLKSCRDKILHLNEESLKKGKSVSLVKILEKEILKRENIKGILEDIRKKKRSLRVNNDWRDAVDELVKRIVNYEEEDIEKRVENERIEKLLIRNCLMEEVIKIEEKSKKRKYEEDIERCVRNKKES